MLSERMKKGKDNYINSRPHISYERARIWTESHKKTEGMEISIRRAIAFKDTCENLGVTIFDGELIVGASGEFRKCGILTPEFSWTWVDREMDNFDVRSQDPYEMTAEQRNYVREKIFPYWKGKSLEETFLAQIDPEIARITVDTGIVDNDSKWRQAVGELTPDYQDVLFKKGFRGIINEAKEKLEKLSHTNAEDHNKIIFYKSIITTSEGIIILANRYADEAERLAAIEKKEDRKKELLQIAKNCRKVPEFSPKTFWEACQFFWFVQLSSILTENPLALNPGRFDQFMYPYYEIDIMNGTLDNEWALEIIECCWLKMSEWVWTISANTADFFAGYNQFQNLTIGGKKRDGSDATNDLSYLCLKATAELQTHQPGISVRVHQDVPQKFMDAITELVSLGTGFPAIHNDSAGYQMLINNGYEPEDARDWSNCGCVVPHFRKTHEWTSAVNLNITAALEMAINSGKMRLTGEKLGITDKIITDYTSYEELEEAFYKEFDRLIEYSVYNTILAQKLHKTMVPRPFLSSTQESCLENGVDLVNNGNKYNIGPVITSVGLAVTSNALAVIKKLIFEDKILTLETLHKALEKNWEGYEEIRQLCLNVPKYGNDDEYVDSIARRMANHQYNYIKSFRDINGNSFLSAYMGISNYLPTGKILGATPDGRRAKEPISEGVSPYAGTDKSTPLAAMKSAAKMNQDIHSGGTLLNLRLGSNLIKSKRGQSNLGSIIQEFFSLGAFHVQFNTLSTEVLLKAQEKPQEYKDLLVRVAGYSTQFVNLSKAMQDAIIARNAHNEF